jgi:hypothetical protein
MPGKARIDADGALSHDCAVPKRQMGKMNQLFAFVDFL